MRGKLMKFIADNMPVLIDQCLQIRSKLYDSKLKETMPSGPPCRKETNHQNFIKQKTIDESGRYIFSNPSPHHHRHQRRRQNLLRQGTQAPQPRPKSWMSVVQQLKIV